MAGTIVLSAALLIAMSTHAAADSPCSSLPYDTTIVRGNWLTGGVNSHGSSNTIKAARGNIRTYNGFVADTSPQYDYLGAEAGWLSVVGRAPNGNAVGAQVGYHKDPAFTGHPFDPVFFDQYTNSDGVYFPPDYYGAIFAPTEYTYYVRWVAGPNGGRIYEFRENGQLLGMSSELFWNPYAHEAASEAHNYTGDQLPGDRNAHATFRSIQWSPDDVSWFGGAFGSSSEPWLVGAPQGNYPDRAAFADLLGPIDGSNFDTWDARCP